MRRRQFLELLGGAAVSYPLGLRRTGSMNRREFIASVAMTAMLSAAARAQQTERPRRVDVLLAELTEDDPYYEGRLTALTQTLRGLGWIDGKNLRLVIHRVSTKPAEIRKHITELLAEQPDVVVSGGSTTTAPLVQIGRAHV